MRHAFRPRFARYMADEAGNIALTFGLALLALLMMVGVALDSRRMDVTQNSIQAAVDTAIIAGAREYLIQSAKLSSAALCYQHPSILSLQSCASEELRLG